MRLAALAYARMGWPVLPLHHPIFGAFGVRCSCSKGEECGSIGKHPRNEHGVSEATTDESVITAWWTKWKHANIGGAAGIKAGWWALDIDPDKGGDDSLAELVLSRGGLPDTVEQLTGSGGRHLLFSNPSDQIGNRVGFAPGLDTRADGGYIVLAPSLHASKRRYTWEASSRPGEVDIAPAPVWLKNEVTLAVDVAATDGAVDVPEADLPELDERIALARARMASVPPAVAGQYGHTQAFIAASILVRGFALPAAVALTILSQDYNPRCVPPWSAADLAHKIKSADENGKLPRGIFVTPPAAPTSAVTVRPNIRLSTEIHDIVDAAITALATDPDVYQRDGELVRVVRIAESEADAAILAGTPLIRRIASATLRERLTRSARWWKFDKRADDWVSAMPTDPVVQAVHDRAEYRSIRPIVGIAEAPMLRPDGTVMQTAGYDGGTGYVYLPSIQFPPVADAPTQEDARYALDELHEVFADFPHRSEADAVVPIAAVLTLLARPAIKGSIAAFIIDATTRGSGKTLQADCVSLIATGRIAGKMTWPADEAELEKVLSSYALRGASLILFDNVTTPFGGGPLDKVLTSRDRVELRVLGKSEAPSVTWRALIMASGNNVAVSGDTCRRVLISRLEPQTDTPETRGGFKHDPLLGWVEAERPRLVVAALTILRAWTAAGRPLCTPAKWGSFEEWTGIVPQALLFAGAADPMGAKLKELSDDPDRLARASLIDGIERLAPSGGISVRSMVSSLYPSDRRGHGDGPPDGFEALRETLESIVRTKPGAVPTTHSIGNALRKHRGAVVDGKRLVSTMSGPTAVWSVESLSMSQEVGR